MNRTALVLLIAAVASAGCHRVTRSGAVPGAAAPVMITSMGRIPRNASRFEIESVDDSTAHFRPFEVKWLRPGMLVYAVDPSRRDALVARLRIVRGDSGRMVALVTAQVTKLTDEHFVLAVEPKPPWYRRRLFWWGAVAGGVLGTTGTIVAR